MYFFQLLILNDVMFSYSKKMSKIYFVCNQITKCNQNPHHHILEGLSDDEGHAPVGKYTCSAGKPSCFDRENF